MIRTTLRYWFIIMAGLVSLVSLAADTPIFGDDFSTSALLAEKWKPTPAAAWEIADGVFASLKEGGTRSASANLEHDGPVTVRVRLKSPELLASDWCGVIVRGVVFMLRPQAYGYAYRIDGAERSLGNTRAASPPRANTWYEFEITNRGQSWQWKVDGALIAEFRESNTVQGSGNLLSLATSGSPVIYDDVQVIALSSNPNASPNLLRNASFEQPIPDHIPPGWKPWHTVTIPPEVFWHNWQVVSGDAYHGDQALRIHGNTAQASGFFSNSNGVTVGQPMTFSVYLKAEHPETKVKLQVWEWLGKWHRKIVEVGTEWQRYSITVPAPEKNQIRVGAEFLGDSWIMADAAQLELTDALSAWRLSDRDQEASREPYADLPIPESRELTLVDQPPVLDGKLDDAVWNEEALMWPLRLPKDGQPQEKTDAYIVFHDGTLYVGMRCHDSQPETIKAAPAERDQGSIFAQDNIEIFLDPELDRADYFQLTVAASGAQFDAGPGRNRGWDGTWQAKTFIGDGFWSVEAALPLSMLGLTPLTNRAWGINLCRNQRRLGEISSTALSFSPNFHIPERYPTLVWPDGVDMADYLILPGELAIIEERPGVARFTGTLTNRTGNDLELDLEGTFADGTAWELSGFTVPAGVSKPFAVALPKTPANKGGETYLTAAIRTAGETARLLRSLHQSIPVQPVLDCLLERSVYATEANATVIATLRLPAETLAGASLKIEPGRGTFTDLSRHLTRSFPIDDLPVGEHKLTVTLIAADGQPIASGKLLLRKLPPTQPAVAVDHARRCLVVNGKPFLAIAPLYGVRAHNTPEQVDRLINHAADSGFRTVMIVGKIDSEAMIAHWDRLFERARERQLMVVAWPGGFNRLPDETFGPFIDRYKSHPSLLAWLPVDEPELYTTAEPTIATLRYFAERDPYHPSYMNNSVMAVPSRFAGLPGDILSIDDYLTNRPNREVSEMVRAVRSTNEVAIPTRRPTWMFLVGNNLHNHNREPSAGEQVAQTYGSVIAGTSGVFYFLGTILSPDHWAATVRTNEELMRLEPVILSLEPAPAVQSSVPAIELISRRVGSQVYIICVNVEDRPVEARLQLDIPAGKHDALVMFEQRLTTIEDGMLRDSFAPHERHVYRLNLAP